MHKIRLFHKKTVACSHEKLPGGGTPRCGRVLTRHRLSYFRTHDRLVGEGGSDPPPPAIPRTNGRIEPREAAFERSPWEHTPRAEQIFEFVFSNKNVCFWTNLVSGFQKCNFYFCAMSTNAQNCSSKNDIIKGYGFWAIWLPTIRVGRGW